MMGRDRTVSDAAFERLRAEAENPETSPDRLAELANVAPLRQIVAANPNVSMSLFFSLGHEFPREFLANPLLPLIYLVDPKELMEISRFTALAVLRLDETPLWLLGAWRQNPDELVREAVRYHIGQLDDPERESGPAKAEAALQRTPITASLRPEGIHFPPLVLPDWIVLALRRHRNADVSAAVLRTDISALLLTQLLKRTDLRQHAKQQDLWQAIARHPNAPAGVLGQLAHDDDPLVRAAVAQNLNTSRDTLKHLSRDSVTAVRREVAYNPRTPADVLNRLADDPEYVVRASIARNRNTLLHALAHDRNSSVREAVARNPHTSLKILRHLLKDADDKVRGSALAAIDNRSKTPPVQERKLSARQQYRRIAEILAESREDIAYSFIRLILLAYPELSDHVLAEHATSWRWPERYVIARHPNAGRDTLEELASDGNRFVRAAARARLGEGVMESEAAQ
jgi:hypothetical protein